MTQEVQLNTGRKIAVKELRQYGTYEGLLEGLPTSERNKRLIQQLRSDESIASYGVAPVLLPVTERPIELGRQYPFGTPAALPPVIVVARFASMRPTTNGQGDASGLTVVWFQDDFCWPPALEVLSQLERLDWESLAASFEF